MVITKKKTTRFWLSATSVFKDLKKGDLLTYKARSKGKDLGEYTLRFTKRVGNKCWFYSQDFTPKQQQARDHFLVSVITKKPD